MLYLLHMGNHEEVTYTGGQQDIIHLVADVPKAVKWAERKDRRRAFPKANQMS